MDEELTQLRAVAEAANTLFTVLSQPDILAVLDSTHTAGDWRELGDALEAAGYEPQRIQTATCTGELF